MRIQSTYPVYNRQCRSLRQQNTQTRPQRNLVTKSVLPNTYYPVFKGDNPILNRLKDFSVEEYNSLSPEELEKIRTEYETTICTNPYRKKKNELVEQLHDVASDLIIDNLNEKYGEDNWVLISLGRSASSIVKVVGYKVGEDRAKQIPMSKAKKYASFERIDSLEGTQELDEFKDYLTSIGLGADEVSKSDKHYVLVDYCASGKSLFGAENLLNSRFLYNDNPRFHAESIMSFIPEDHPHRRDIHKALVFMKFKDISGIEKCEDLKETKNSFIDTSKIDDKINFLRFKLLDNVMSTKSD